MARPDSRPKLPDCLERPRISLLGDVNPAMAERLIEGLNDARMDDDIAVELTTIGGDAEIARRMALELELARSRRSGALLFLGKSAVYSAGVTIMSAFPATDRYVSGDCVLLVHERQLSETIDLNGSIRASLELLSAKRAELDNGLRLERETFERLAAGTKLSADEIADHARRSWYLTARQALDAGLVEAIVPV